MIFVAASKSLALRSFIFTSAMSRSCERRIVPAGVLPVSLEPYWIRAAFFRRKLAVGVLVTNEKERSA